MLDRLNSEDIFLEHLDLIEKVASIAARKHGLWGADEEDFASWVKIKLMEDDYAVLRKFRGDSSVRTFIASVVVRYSHAYSRELRGRWRPSAAAERLGPPAPELETLVWRDGYTVAQAGEKLRTAGHTTLSDGELARLLARLPERAPLRPVEVAADPVLNAAAGLQGADGGVAAAEERTRHGEVMDALRRAMERMAPTDQMILRMHFGDGYSLAHVARALRLEQKPLYRRIDRLRERLREYLEAEGVSATVLREVLNREGS